MSEFEFFPQSHEEHKENNNELILCGLRGSVGKTGSIFKLRHYQ
jgi:hypothetical protein